MARKLQAIRLFVRMTRCEGVWSTMWSLSLSGDGSDGKLYTRASNEPPYPPFHEWRPSQRDSTARLGDRDNGVVLPKLPRATADGREMGRSTTAGPSAALPLLSWCRSQGPSSGTGCGRRRPGHRRGKRCPDRVGPRTAAVPRHRRPRWHRQSTRSEGSATAARRRRCGYDITGGPETGQRRAGQGHRCGRVWRWKGRDGRGGRNFPGKGSKTCSEASKLGKGLPRRRVGPGQFGKPDNMRNWRVARVVTEVRAGRAGLGRDRRLRRTMATDRLAAAPRDSMGTLQDRWRWLYPSARHGSLRACLTRRPASPAESISSEWTHGAGSGSHGQR